MSDPVCACGCGETAAEVTDIIARADVWRYACVMDLLDDVRRLKRLPAGDRELIAGVLETVEARNLARIVRAGVQRG